MKQEGQINAIFTPKNAATDATEWKAEIDIDREVISMKLFITKFTLEDTDWWWNSDGYNKKVK